MSDVIIREEKARIITDLICSDILKSYEAHELSKWHSYNLVSLYVSKYDNTEIDIELNRGFKTTANLRIDINPEESVDRLSDRLIDTIRISIKRYIEDIDDLPVEFDSNEHITRIRISRVVNQNKDTFTESGYTIEFDTEKYDTLVTTDHKLGSNPRIAGKRMLVSDIWNKYNQLDDYEGLETIVEDMDNLVTQEEVEEAIKFAKDSELFDFEKEDEEFNSEPVDFDDFDLSSDSDRDVDEFEDNR
jgi:uncharacterized protein (DUF433 family)